MRLFIRLFFRLLRLILTPFMLIGEWLTTPKAIARDAEQQRNVDENCQQLALYQFSSCPFCIKVRKEIARLGLNIERRDAQHNQQYRLELAQAGGKVKVPCLRISTPGQTTTWLYESQDIISYLQRQFDSSAAVVK
ncbi:MULTISPECIES: glutathione S-transferase N-terminal domain-containing protein [unclassified Arsukibacterium]|uniref:glutathione S-transferase N-terminal domain-containing protein n=1 Tax=unclassified Arsukibacterium TaxID=2635278 RepID=UPI000C4E9BC9|nr:MULTISPECIES: glutathione S-transferase N-terminal domain-containing protein [unclassified Arsukibacterium]MAA95175.1 glutaredoxin [Rheinheimera sp.]MBM35150.1 glutaredoxin [Rheinheimera sp.]HAW93521.1 glutaredoxin [Candidatus Azambacteria bacterium]|tara:strand:+ start:204 stop:611 length:408 start_codon:yes stop_codon:yes gene_type:complete